MIGSPVRQGHRVFVFFRSMGGVCTDMISRVSNVMTSESDQEAPGRGSGAGIRDLAQLFKILADEPRLRIREISGRPERVYRARAGLHPVAP